MNKICLLVQLMEPIVLYEKIILSNRIIIVMLPNEQIALSTPKAIPGFHLQQREIAMSSECVLF